MEVNGRHNLSSLLAVRCGINFPWIQYEHLVHGKLPSACDYETGMYWIDLVRDISVAPRLSASRSDTPLTQYLKPYFAPSRLCDSGLQRPEAVSQAVRGPGQDGTSDGPRHPRRIPAGRRARALDQSTTLRGLRLLSLPEPFLKHRTGSAPTAARRACRTSSSST